MTALPLSAQTDSHNQWPPKYYQAPRATPAAQIIDLYPKLQISLDVVALCKIGNVIAALDNLRAWTDNWDGYGSKKPKSLAVNRAKKFVEILFSAVSAAHLDWLAPHVTASENGEVVLEWWKNNKKITVYSSTKKISYLKIANPILEEMEDGILNPPTLGECTDIWQWLLSK